jgi:phage-related protein
VDSGKGTYRVVYIAKLPPSAFVLHAFMKKFKTGRKMPSEVKRRILSRLKAARELSKELGQ